LIPDADIWRAALLMTKRYGADAMLEAAERADQLLDEGDMAGAETWHPDGGAYSALLCLSPNSALSISETDHGFQMSELQRGELRVYRSR